MTTTVTVTRVPLIFSGHFPNNKNGCASQSAVHFLGSSSTSSASRSSFSSSLTTTTRIRRAGFAVLASNSMAPSIVLVTGAGGRTGTVSLALCLLIYVLCLVTGIALEMQRDKDNCI